MSDLLEVRGLTVPVVAQVATRIAVVRAGQFLEVGDSEQVLHQPHQGVAFRRA